MTPNSKARLLAPALLLAIALPAAADFLIAPRGPYNPNDFSGKQSPFLLSSDVVPDVRYQQVYSGQEFPSTGGLIRITDLSFAAALGPIDVTLPNVSIHLSTTARAPDGLSTTFAQNVGADDGVVLSGPLHFFQNGTGPVGSFGEIYNI